MQDQYVRHLPSRSLVFSERKCSCVGWKQDAVYSSLVVIWTISSRPSLSRNGGFVNCNVILSFSAEGTSYNAMKNCWVLVEAGFSKICLGTGEGSFCGDKPVRRLGVLNSKPVETIYLSKSQERCETLHT